MNSALKDFDFLRKYAIFSYSHFPQRSFKTMVLKILLISL